MPVRLKRRTFSFFPNQRFYIGPVVLIPYCGDNCAKLDKQMYELFFIYAYCHFINIFFNAALFCSTMTTVAACDRRTPYSARFAYSTSLLEYKGTCECVCYACMTVWNASADTSVFCTFTQHELDWRDCVQLMCRPINWDVCASVHYDVYCGLLCYGRNAGIKLGLDR